MDNLELYQEENRAQLIELNNGVSNLSKLIQTQIDNYKAPSDKIEVNTEKEIEVTNLSEIKEWFDDLSQTITKKLEDNKPLDKIEVTNLKDSKQDTIKIENLDDLKQYFTTLTKAIEDNRSIVNVSKQSITFPKSPSEAISVRLSDGKSFYNAIASIASGGLSKLAQSNLEILKFNAQGQLEVDANFSGEIDIGDVQIKNVSGTKINPSTEEKQDDTNAILNNIDSNTDSIETKLDTLNSKDFATSDKQDTLFAELQKKADVTETQPVYDGGNNLVLREILKSLNIPLWFDPATGTLKVSGSGQTFSTITTVGTVTNQTNIGGLAADPMVSSTLNSVWVEGIRNILT